MRRAALFFMGVLVAWSAGAATHALDSLARPVSGDALVRFGARYGSERPRTHWGLDLAGMSGEPVRAPCGGRVVFAGLIPADGGGRTTAVTIEPEDGVAVTVSPLAEATVTRGDVVDRGAAIGVLAAEGDASSDEPHLHLSVRRDGRYVDPEPLLEPHGPVHASGPGQTGVELDPGPSVSTGQRPETAQGGSLPAVRTGFFVQAARGVSAQEAGSSTQGAAELRTGFSPSAAGADAYGVRAAYWRVTKARRSIRSASARCPAVDREASRSALLGLRARRLPVSGAAGVAAAATAACAAASALRRSAPVRV